MRRSLAVLVVVPAVVSAVTGCAASSGRAQPHEAAPTPVLTDAQQHQLLEDTWVTPVITRSEVARVLRDAGYGAYTDTVASTQPYPVAYNLRLTGDSYWLRTDHGLQPDHGRWELHGDQVVLLPADCPCSLAFAWRLTGDRLHLDLVRDTSAALDGVPDEAYATALYAAAPLTRFAAAP